MPWPLDDGFGVPPCKCWNSDADWQKAMPTGVAGYAADAWENVTRPFSAPAPGPKKPAL